MKEQLGHCYLRDKGLDWAGARLKGRGDQLCDPKAPSSACLCSVTSSPARDRETGVWTGGKGRGRPGQEQDWTCVSAGWAEAIRAFRYTSQLSTGTAVLDRKTYQALTPWPLRIPSHKSSRPASGSLTQFRKYLNL